MRVYPELLLFEKKRRGRTRKFVYLRFNVSSEEASPQFFGSRQITGRG